MMRAEVNHAVIDRAGTMYAIGCAPGKRSVRTVTMMIANGRYGSP